MKKLTSILMVAFVVTLGATANANDWRQPAAAAAESLAESIERLDEVLHEVYEEQQTEVFKKAVEEIHHIESLVLDLTTDMMTAPFPALCEDFSHLYQDLVDIRLYLIQLGLERNPHVVQRWNEMVHIYNNRLNPYFRGCGHHRADSAENLLETL